MPLFSRIVTLGGLLGRAEKRRHRRHQTGHSFPVKAVVTLISRDSRGHVASGLDESSRDWSGRLLNISAGGVNIALPAAAMAKRGEPSRLRFSFDDWTTSFPCRVAHFRTLSHYSSCGLEIQFGNPDEKRSFGQVLETVRLGGSFKPVPTRSRRSASVSVETRYEYRGEKGARLEVSLDSATGRVTRFEFETDDYGVRWSTRNLRLEFFRSLPRDETEATAAKLTAADQKEIRRHLQMVIASLPRSVPADIRDFLDKISRPAIHRVEQRAARSGRVSPPLAAG